MDEHSILNPRWEKVPFSARDGKEYVLTLCVTYSVGAYIFDNARALSELNNIAKLSPETLKKSYDILLDILSLMLRDDYSHMTVEWLAKNLDMQQHFYMFQKISKPLYEYLSSMGFTEATQPEKESESESS